MRVPRASNALIAQAGSAQAGARPVIECQGVTRDHPGGIRALRGIDLTVYAGDLLGVVGPSGSGKTTLLHIMGSLDRATGGVVRIDGHDVSRMSDAALSHVRAHSIGFVFQSFHLSPLLNVRENVAEGLLYAGVPYRQRQRRASETLERLGLSDRLSQRPQSLSGGERQRVAIARALVGNPAVILADEPTGNLDSDNGASVMSILADLAAHGTAVVVVTHDLEVAAVMDTRITLRDGLRVWPTETTEG